MSKRKRTKKVVNASTSLLIHKILRAEFHCTEEEINLIDQALIGYCPIEIADYLNDIAAGKVPLRMHQPISVDMEDGTFQKIRLTNHPIALLYDYLREKYNEPFSTLYWNALITASEKNFYGMARYLKKQSFFQEGDAR